MDTRNLVDNHLAALPPFVDSSGIRSVVAHIDAAERHLSRALAEQDDLLFNDVVYRSNQAFEGALKEAYFVLSGNVDHKKTPNEIEKFFESNGAVHRRVLDLFTRYRQDWRNPSTHDYRLVFRESEAILALLSVTSFFVVLLDQILEQLARVHPPKAQQTLNTEVGIEKALMAEVGEIAEALIKQFRMTLELTEAQLLGGLAGGIEIMDKDVKVLIEPRLTDRNGVVRRPDLVVRRGDEKVVIELTRGPRESVLKSGESQLLSYLVNMDFEQGALIVLSPGSEPPSPKEVSATVGGKTVSYVLWS